MLEYREIAPSPRLRPHVRCYWMLRGDGAGPAERILPDGTFELVLHLGDPFVRDGAAQPASMVVGELRRPVVVAPGGRVDVIGVRFNPGGLAPFVRMPAGELCDSVIAAADVFRCDVHPLVAEEGSDRRRIAAIERLLLARQRDDDRLHLVRGAVDAIRLHGGTIRTSDLAKRLGVTERSLERAFHDRVGVAPKVYARMVRFHRAIREPELDAAYYDASHLTRDCHEFAGTTPAALLRERNAINDAFVGNVQDAEVHSA